MGSGLKKQQRQQPMPGYRQSHALYVLHEIKWIMSMYCFHGKMLSFSWEINILTEEGSKTFFYDHNDNPVPLPH